MVRAGMMYQNLFDAAGKFGENQLKECILCASIRQAFQVLFCFQKSTDKHYRNHQYVTVSLCFINSLTFRQT